MTVEPAFCAKCDDAIEGSFGRICLWIRRCHPKATPAADEAVATSAGLLPPHEHRLLELRAKTRSDVAVGHDPAAFADVAEGL